MPRVILKAVARKLPGTSKFTVKMVEVKVPDFKFAYLSNPEMAPAPKRRKTKMEKRRIRKKYELDKRDRKTG